MYQVCEGSLAIVLECSEEVMMSRLLQRSKSSDRVDDNEVTIRKRFNSHKLSTRPVIQYFEALGKLKEVR